MGRISGMQAIKEAVDKYGSSGGNYFKLEKDNDYAEVRMNHGDDMDLDIFIVHKVLVNGKVHYIECPSVDGLECPLCASGFKATPRIFISLLDLRDNQMKIWDRGKTEIGTIMGLITEYGPLNERDYKIQRHGKPNDTKTTYQFYNRDKSPRQLEPRQELLGHDLYIYKRSPEELKQMLDEKIITSADTQASGYKAQSSGNSGMNKMF